MIKPNFLMVGVARCGTTSLYKHLSNHPEIGMSKVKEPKYFSSLNLKLPQNGVADKTVYEKMITDKHNYFKLFSRFSSKLIIGEASSDYFYYHKNTIPLIKKELGDVKIIICLRNPIDRAYSAYNNHLRDSREFLNFRDAIDSEKNRILSNWDWLWHYKTGSLYYEPCLNFINSFSDVKIIFFDELLSDPKKNLQSIYKFLGVSLPEDYKTFKKYSHSGVPKNNFLALITSRNNFFTNKLRLLVLKLIPRSYLESFAKLILKKKDMSKSDEIYLKSFFRDDIKKLSKLLNKNLDHWL